MKRLYSKKSGFTLVEIIIAFAIFAIMATMITQILNLTIMHRTSNKNFDNYLQDQGKTLIAKGQKWAYDESKDKDGTLSLKFKDRNGNDMPMELNYQLKSVDGTVGDAAGINYFVGDITYADGFEDNMYIPAAGDENNPSDSSEIGGSSQMSRFDTRITGTKGINSIKVTYTYNASADEYTFSVTVYDSGVDAVIKSHSQVSLFFGEGTPGGKLATVKEVNGGTKDQNVLKNVKKCGLNGVNIHCNGSGFNGSTTVFKVKFNEKINNLGFGSGSNVSGDTFTMYKYDKTYYANIFGAYEKKTS